MPLEDTVASNGEPATGIQQTVMDLFSLKHRTILVTGEYAASSTSGSTTWGKNKGTVANFAIERAEKARQEDWV